ncbi:unnamed protein product [Bemisia tabaci]|uniref:Major royal jelly protein n=1 Tax=Bemisia tabaci TaxID=7038 RepID=A0A9P0AII9_BEMTA|nr:unnamed protein product [Bemisia tabaci]
MTPSWHGPILVLLHSLTASSTNEFSLRRDPLGHDPQIEVVHLYQQFPVGVAVSRSGRPFTCYAPGLDALNVYNSSNDVYQVVELTGFDTDAPYPNASYNQPPGGAVDTSGPFPVSAGLPDYFVSIESIFIDYDDVLWVLDCGRVIYESVLLESTYGGPKLIAFDLATDTVIRTYVFSTEAVRPNSFLGDVRVDTVRRVAYLPDFSPDRNNAICVLDLDTGDAWRTLARDFMVTAMAGFVPFVQGFPLYAVKVSGSGQAIGPVTIPFGVDSVALSPDTDTLYYSTVGGRYLYSVPTDLLRNRNTPATEIVAAVRVLGEKGFAVGLTTDSLGFVYADCNEQDAVSRFDPDTGKVEVFVRDERIDFAAKLFAATDGYLYFDVTQFDKLPSVFRGQGPLTLVFSKI